MKKIDVHIHTVLNDNMVNSEMKITSADKMLKFQKKKDIKKSIIMCMGESKSPNNEDCMEICRQYKDFYWNCNFDKESPETVFERMADYKEAGAVGVGELCINEPMDSPFLTEVFTSAEKMELPVLIHMSPRAGYAYGVVDEPGLPKLELVLQNHPKLKIVGHSQVFWIEISGDAPTGDDERYSRGEGKVASGGRLVQLFRKYSNLYGDLSAGSGFCAITRDEKFGLSFLQEFEDRLMYGTDTVDIESKWQVPLGQWMETKFKEGKLSEVTMKKIFYENAERLYGLDKEEKKTIVVDTPCGKIQGICQDTQNAYLGIRYGKAKRFSYPSQVKEWDGTYDATHYGNACLQMRSFHAEKLNQDQFFYHEFRESLSFHYSDDCLYLNIWTPKEKKDKKLPVIVFIHGGAFLGGCSAEKHLMNPQWTGNNVIAVTLNYRLGPFGFMCSTDGVKEAGHTGNYGLYDQVTALQWIKDNIEAFGGDSGNVTLMGQSAGGMCVLQMCTSQQTKNLFQKAVILSGGGRSESFTGKNPVENSIKIGDKAIQEAGCESLEEFRQLSAEKILSIFMKELMSDQSGLAGVSPVMDGALIRYSIEESLKKNKEHRIPYLMCCTSEDLWMPEIISAIQNWAKTEMEHGNNNCYTAYFSRQLPGDKSGAFHTADLWYWMGTLGNSWRPMEERDYALSNEMKQYLTSFAHKGTPDTKGLPTWKCYSQSKNQMMVFGDEMTVQKEIG